MIKIVVDSTADIPPDLRDEYGIAVVPILAQFGQMQQHMFEQSRQVKMQQQMLEQFHQAMMMMFQMFGSLHRDQMKVVREELDQVRSLSAELEDLRAKAAATPPVPHAPVPAAVDPPPERAGGEVHDQLFLRMAQLQEQRQTRWWKILGMITGSGSPSPAAPNP